MKFMEKLWDNLGIFEPADKEEPAVNAEPERRPKRHKTHSSNHSSPTGVSLNNNINNVVSLPTASQSTLAGVAALKQLKVMVVEPVSFDDAQHVADHLRAKKPVVVNLENTDPDITRRMVDFISGTTYALGGTIQKIGNYIFLCAPQNVDVAYDAHENPSLGKSFFSWR